jgi:nucleotide-binding universal stress UspA family protein
MAMLRSMLVSLDGSSYSQRAVELGIDWARQTSALLVGLGTIDQPTITRGEAAPIGGSYFKHQKDDARLADARRQVEQFLARFTLCCAEAQVPCKVLEDVGLPTEQILLEAQRYDLILLGQQTYCQFETQQGPDHTLQDVVRNSPRPVVVVPLKPVSGKATLIAYDGSLQAARALHAFRSVELPAAGPVHVVSVHTDGKEAARQADRAAEFLRFHDIDAQRQAIATKQAPTEVLLDQIRQLDAGLLVMGAYGQSTLREFFFGSVTTSLLKASGVPLFLYH